MPSRGWKRTVAAATAVGSDMASDSSVRKVLNIATPNPNTKNDGTLMADGIRVRPKAWGNCADENCGRPIYFIKVGDKCTRHTVSTVMS